MFFIYLYIPNQKKAQIYQNVRSDFAALISHDKMHYIVWKCDLCSNFCGTNQNSLKTKRKYNHVGVYIVNSISLMYDQAYGVKTWDTRSRVLLSMFYVIQIRSQGIQKWFSLLWRLCFKKVKLH